MSKVKYFFNNKSLKEWCLENDYSYNTAIAILNRLRLKFLNENELVNKTVEELKKTPKKVQYYYKGMSLRDYCKKHNLNYQTIIARINAIKKVSKNLTNKKVVEMVMEEYSDSRCKFIYKGMSLKKYCELHDYSYESIYRKVKDLSQEEANKVMNEFFKHVPIRAKTTTRYKIFGVSLRKYCEEHNYIYSTVKSYIRIIKNNNPEIENNDAALKAVEYYKLNHIYKERYFYKGERLVDYLKKVNCPYKDFMAYLSYMSIEDTYNLSDEVIKKCIYKCRIKQRKDLFKKLENATDQEIFLIAEKLSIQKESIDLLIKYKFPPKEALKFVWYFGINKEEKLFITEDIINKKLSQIPTNKMELNELIGYYKSGLCDTRKLIIENCYNPCVSILNTLIKTYSLNKNNELIEDLKSQMIIVMYTFIERTNSNNLGQIINYMNKLVKGELLKQILNFLEDNKTISLNQELNNSTKTRQDFLINKDSIDTEYISSDLLEKILTLTQLEQKVIILIYQKQYSKEEVSIKLNLSIEEVTKIEEVALNELRENITSQLKK